ncbi:MAG: hypothetical protein JXQ27_14205, partial [Acidobacteria bacterium]|nr:hypothetical protein [Acidobacteriota bacterium]
AQPAQLFHVGAEIVPKRLVILQQKIQLRHRYTSSSGDDTSYRIGPMIANQISPYSKNNYIYRKKP